MASNDDIRDDVRELTAQVRRLEARVSDSIRVIQTLEQSLLRSVTQQIQTISPASGERVASIMSTGPASRLRNSASAKKRGSKP